MENIAISDFIKYIEMKGYKCEYNTLRDKADYGYGPEYYDTTFILTKQITDL